MLAVQKLPGERARAARELAELARQIGDEMTDLTDPRAIWLKGILFLLLGLLSAGLLIARTLDFTIAVLLGLTVWAFCRSYYFAFYVIQHYVDPNFKFAGLIPFIQYALSNREHDSLSSTDDEQN